MDRLISEQAVIESIEFFQMNPQHFDFVNLIDDIKDIPSAEPRWIPCSERLPEEFADVFCSTNAGEVFIATYLGELNEGVDCFDDDNGMMWEGDVIAWMPLPEPYKTESEAKE